MSSLLRVTFNTANSEKNEIQMSGREKKKKQWKNILISVYGPERHLREREREKRIQSFAFASEKNNECFENAKRERYGKSLLAYVSTT